MKLVLFDIDGTLILTGGAGMRAFSRGLRQVFNLSVEREVINPDGKTDPLIAKEVLAYYGQADRWNEKSREALFASYLTCLEEEMQQAAANNAIRILPGVLALLKELASKAEFALGIVTGNLEEGARIKLSNAGLNGYFGFGGYGSDSEDRTALIRTGIERGARWITPAAVDAVFVVGDTPLDILHGQAAGASVIAVASARYSLVDLKAYNPDMLVPDLTESDSILRFLRESP